MKKNNRVRVHINVETDIMQAMSLYTAQDEDNETVSDLINRVLRNYLDDPFVWEDTMMYAKAFPKDEEE